MGGGIGHAAESVTAPPVYLKEPAPARTPEQEWLEQVPQVREPELPLQELGLGQESQLPVQVRLEWKPEPELPLPEQVSLVRWLQELQQLAFRRSLVPARNSSCFGSR